MVVQCCVCKKVREKGTWKKEADASPYRGNTSHGYCPTCADDAFREVREYHRHNLRGMAAAKAVNL